MVSIPRKAKPSIFLDFSKFLSNPSLGIYFAVLYFLALLPDLGKNRLLGLDESMYANVALAEARDHHWLPMFFEGHPFWEKPPLVLWLQGFCLWVFGPHEAAVRIVSAITGAICVYFVYQLGARLGKSGAVGLVCALLMALQEHFILYCRIATMDMPLVCCFLGLWWELSKALDSLEKEKSPRQLLMAGLWFAAAIGIKSWFGLMFLPAVAAALYFTRPWPFSLSQVWTRLFLPAFLALTGWIALYLYVYGKPFWDWEMGYNLSGRLHGGGFSSLESLETHLKFYAVLAQDGLAFFWPLLPLGFSLWIRDAWGQFRKTSAKVKGVLGWTFFFYYLFFLLVLMATLINYLLPLIPVAAVSVAFLLRPPEDGRIAAAGCFAALLGAVNGSTGYAFVDEIFLMSLAVCFVPVMPVRWTLDRKWLWATLVFLILLCGWKAQDYLRHPPDPNHAWVAAVLAHPARYLGEPLIFVGEHTDARAMEFYCDYQITPIPQIPSQRPAQALLFGYQNEAVFFPAAEVSSKPLSK